MSSLLTLHRNDTSVPSRRRPFSRIVVGVDSSTSSERAMHLAISLAAGDVRTELVFCHVIDIPRMLARADHLAEDYEIALEAAQSEARSLLAGCVAAAGDARVYARACVRYGKPASEIATLADVYAADLIVVGSRPSGKWHRFLNGSVRDEIVRDSDIPVLVAEKSECR